MIISTRVGTAVLEIRTAEVDKENIDLHGLIYKFEKELLHAVIARSGGNKTKAAQYLGLNRTTLIEKCRKYGLHLNKATPMK